MSCISCKNKTSIDRCSSKPLLGSQFCGKHIRCKNPRVWTQVNRIDDHVIRIQTIWRGWWVRNQLSLAGPGVLRRSGIQNEDELVSCDPVQMIQPFNYFAFEEAGKIWAFDIRSLISWFHKGTNPSNPYTKQDIPLKVRQRFRDLVNYRFRSGKECFHDPESEKTKAKQTSLRWVRVAQQMEENGFENVSPIRFGMLNAQQIWVFTDMLRVDCQVLAMDHKNSPESRRQKYVWWIRYLMRQQFRTAKTTEEYSHALSGLLVSILGDLKNPYPYCFAIMSALYRL